MSKSFSFRIVLINRLKDFKITKNNSYDILNKYLRSNLMPKYVVKQTSDKEFEMRKEYESWELEPDDSQEKRNTIARNAELNMKSHMLDSIVLSIVT